MPTRARTSVDEPPARTYAHLPLQPPPPEPDSGHWRRRGLCAQIDVGDLFFPEKGNSNAPAKRICGRCGVRARCLEAALAHDERYGVWGGLGEKERRPLHQARNAARRASARGPVWTPQELRVGADQAAQLIVQGVAHGRIARRLGVTVRSVQRWAAKIRAAEQAAAAERAREEAA